MLKKELSKIISKSGIKDFTLVSPPNSTMGDFALPCFAIAKDEAKSPTDVAEDIADKIPAGGLIKEIDPSGPYVNFFVDPVAAAKLVMKELSRKGFGAHKMGKGKKYLVEYACPNPMKAFHVGHLRNTISGESVCRLLENGGYNVVRVNYQGDVGMHIPKTLWGIEALRDEFEAVISQPLDEQVKFLGKAYAHGATAYEKDEAAQEEIREINKKVYAHDESVTEVYGMAREWSLEYFHTIYTWLGARFDELYFESEVWERGLEIVKEFLKKGVFKESKGAVIFLGSEHGLHDRVFITSEGNPTYEAKDLALAERRFSKHRPDKIIHVVGKEQIEYFKVVFKALEQTLPESVGKEFHLPGGFLQTKGSKMSSRKGQVQLAEDLLYDIEAHVMDVMKDHEVEDREEVIRKVALSAIKYAILKVGVSDDVMFDMKESVQLSGDSGPYLLYIVARIKSILKKADSLPKKVVIPTEVTNEEKQLLLQLSGYMDVVKKATHSLDPSLIARFLFDLAQKFNTFYHACPVLEAEGNVRSFRLSLIARVGHVMEHGLHLLSIDVVEQM